MSTTAVLAEIWHGVTRRYAIASSYAVLIATAAMMFTTSANAQTTFVTPFPSDNTYKVHVFGDAIGPGLFEGLRKGLRLEPDIRVENHSVGNSRLARTRPIDWVARMKKKVSDAPFDIAVLAFGISDRVTIRVEGRRYGVGTLQWNSAYGARVAALIRAAKSKGAAVYWLGLPVMRRNNARRNAETVNAIARERVYRLGGKFVDTWDGFTDAEGNYSPYGPDLTGRVRLLRSKDGAFFTTRGYRKLGHYVERLIRRDVALARSERDVPLAGDDTEQAQVRRLAGTAASRVGQREARRSHQNPTRNSAPTARAIAAAGDHKAQHATVRVQVPAGRATGSRKTVQLRILRPALPAVVVGHIRRRSKSAAAGQQGRSLIGFSKDGASYINSIASGPTATGNALDARASVTQSPYYKALIKGETLAPKAGRVDDFAWPPQKRAPLPIRTNNRGS
ncbi:MAG: hypothetical protein AAFZ01_07600 [Pseudomonadota bacterium]